MSDSDDDVFVVDYSFVEKNMPSEHSAILKQLLSKSYQALADRASSLELRECKSEEASEDARRKASFLLSREHHDASLYEVALRMCATSVAQAPKSSLALARALAERAKLLEHIQRYQESERDIEYALKLVGPGPSKLRVELLARLARITPGCTCWRGDYSRGRAALEKAYHWYAKLKETEEAEEEGMDELESLLDSAKTMLELNCVDNECEPDPKRQTVRGVTNSAVRIAHSEKFGRHLVANKDIEPGEIVCAERFYAASANVDKSYANCNHCLKACWNLIPCDTCDICMYCTERCKRKAWAQYHDIECKVLTYLRQLDKNANTYVCLGLRLLIIAVGEAGESVEDVAISLEDMEETDYHHTEKWELMSWPIFLRLYGLTSCKLYNSIDSITESSVMILIALIKHSNLFKNVDYKSGKELSKNEEVMFIGSLLLKFIKISETCATKFPDQEPLLFDKKDISISIDSYRGTVISTFSSLANHSCNPNVMNICTTNGKIVYYCLTPIKKHEQIFECYGDPFYKASKSQRRNELREYYEFRCFCDACEKNWSASTFHILAQIIPKTNDKVLEAIYSRTHQYLSIFASRCPLELQVQARYCVANDIQILFRKLKFPSDITVFYIITLAMAFKCTVGSCKLLVPSKCKMDKEILLPVN